MSHLFSIITPAFNTEHFILKAMQSVVEQTENDFEYIVVDNGSSDNTLSLVRKFIEEHSEFDIKVISVSPNKGISGGRNLGINAASGSYICLLDADDWWYPSKLERVKEVIQCHQDIHIIGHWEDWIKNNVIVDVGMFREIDNSDAFKDLLFHGNCLSPSATVIKANLIKRNQGFDISLDRGQEDFDCWLRLARDDAKFYMIKEPLSAWLIRNDSLSAKRENHTDAVVDMLGKHFDVLKKGVDNTEVLKKINKRQKWIYAMNYCGCARTMSLNGDYKKSYTIYKKSLGYCKTYWKSYVGIILNFLHL
ncbi:glycosyltransferase family 2 protein [Treponema socranskii]|uniref:glycosyltransferase family 2 protein n=1 Tax=Treponema socranskii TaxID=53419 RepID=UPI003D6F6A0E